MRRKTIKGKWQATISPQGPASEKSNPLEIVWFQQVFHHPYHPSKNVCNFQTTGKMYLCLIQRLFIPTDEDKTSQLISDDTENYLQWSVQRVLIPEKLVMMTDAIQPTSIDHCLPDGYSLCPEWRPTKIKTLKSQSNFTGTRWDANGIFLHFDQLELQMVGQ